MSYKIASVGFISKNHSRNAEVCGLIVITWTFVLYGICCVQQTQNVSLLKKREQKRQDKQVSVRNTKILYAALREIVC